MSAGRQAAGGRAPSLAALAVGASLTAVATVAALADRAGGGVLAEHVRAGYPAYSAERIDAAVTAYVAIITLSGALGVLGWAFAIWATARRVRWARWPITALFLIGTVLALTALLTRDTSGEVGLAPLFGWLQVLPCVAGLVAVVLSWRRS